jgi:hypothetical protein
MSQNAINNSGSSGDSGNSALPKKPARSGKLGVGGGLMERRHPNELDLRRITRLLEKRERYRYVSPLVEPIADGYRIVSPCCSRNVDDSGGNVDIATLLFDEKTQMWKLFSRDHQRQEWVYYDSGRNIDVLLLALIADPYREFWK